MERKQKERTAKLKRKLQALRVRRKEIDERSKSKLQSEINEVLKTCVERINVLQRDDLDLYERRKLAIEFKEFVDKFVNPEYRDNFYEFINHILHKYRMEVHNTEAQANVDREDELAPAHVEWPLNCTHIKIAYGIWNRKKSQFRNPLEIAQLLRKYYYQEMSVPARQLDIGYGNNYINTNWSDVEEVEPNNISVEPVKEIETKTTVVPKFDPKSVKVNSEAKSGQPQIDRIEKAKVDQIKFDLSLIHI